ncbi:MAG TPA: hypothetical protein VGM30_14970 [Puia sp.]|jgi:hypothetical protein
MSDQQAVYELSLKDGLSPKVEEADHHVNKLEHSMEGLSERVAHVAEAFGISFAIFKGIEFVHEGVEEMEKLHKAEAGLQNTMENMGTYSQEAFEKMSAGADDLAHHMNYTQAEVLELQSQLGLVGNIGEKEMDRLTKVSADLATKMGTGLSEAGNLLARGINSPEMARRVGMALKIDPGVMEHIQNLAKHGKEAAARMELLAVAESKVGGAAEAAFNADPLARFNKTMVDLKLEVGNAAISLLKVLAPALEWIGTAVRDVAHWVKENWEAIKNWAEILGAIVAPIAAVTIGTWALSAGATALATSLEFAAGIMDVIAANPLALFLSAVAAAVIYCYKHFATFHAFLFGVWEFIKEFGRTVMDIFTALGHVIHGVFTFNWSEIKSGFTQGVDAIADAGTRMGHAYKKGFEEGMADYNKDQATEAHTLIPEKKTGPRPVFASDKVAKEPKTKATGSKSVTINVIIQKLGETHLNVTNIKEGMTKLHDQIVTVLSGAVNDFQVVADH